MGCKLVKTLTRYYRYYKKEKKQTKKLVCIISILLLIVIFSVSFYLGNIKTKKYSEKIFYLVYAGKFTLASKANEMCITVSDRGGAGVIYYKENLKYVVVSSYFVEADANKVKEQIMGSFPDAGLLKVSASKLTKKVCTAIEKENGCKRYYKQYYEFCNTLHDLTLSVDKAEISEHEVYKIVMDVKQNLSVISQMLKSSTESIGKNMYSSSLIALEQINSFFNSSFIANSVSKNLKKLYINSIIEFESMCETIK